MRTQVFDRRGLPELRAVCKRDGGLPHGAAARLVVAVSTQD